MSLGLIAVAIAVAVPAVARANGAFPDAQTVLAPADRPDELLLAANFGVIISEDGGSTWQWSCERLANAFGLGYQRGAAPRRRLFTLANNGLAFSDDGTCGWSVAGGAVTGRIVTDFFPDAVDANRVLAIAFADAHYAVLASSDGGTTFGPAIYEAPGSDGIGGVETARSAPATIYVSMTSAEGTHPRLARSDDAGAHWTETDLFADLGAGLLRIIAVDPQDASTVLFRWIGADSQAVAITRDGGVTATAALSVPGNLVGFARLADGTLLVAAVVDEGVTPVLHRSRDGGATFSPVPNPPHIRAMSAREGLLYAATDNFADGYALGVSSDAGDTWTAVMAYADVDAILGCLRASGECRATCDALAGLGQTSSGMIWSEAVCTANPQPPPKPSSGCSCGLAARDDGACALVTLLVSCGLLAARRRRRPR